MEKNKENALNQFLGEKTSEPNVENENTKKKVLDEREGLIERVDKILVTKDGKQLLREQY
jgi:hypothetical protein